MNTNIYYIIGAVAVLFIIYMMVLQNIMKKKKQQQLADFNTNHSGNPLTDQQNRLLTFGAILFYWRSENILGIALEKNLDMYIYGLKHQWDITNREEAKDTLNSLLLLNKSESFKPLLQQPTEENIKIRKKIAKGLGIELSVVEQTQSAYAWDICRAVSLTKWCYWCGYLTEDETWAYMEEAAEIANQHGKDWTDYTVSFLLGRTIQGFDLDELIVESKQLLNGDSLYKNKENSDIYKRYSFS
ncbi:MAG: DUF1266 domain-containing protein [Flavobacterium sp.]|uniref:DUF1266 domain-containing protein n=1 Tax=Flavobacterium sp. TaxID=239 RepID=UPI002FC7F152